MVTFSAVGLTMREGIWPSKRAVGAGGVHQRVELPDVAVGHADLCTRWPLSSTTVVQRFLPDSGWTFCSLSFARPRARRPRLGALVVPVGQKPVAGARQFTKSK